MAGKLFIISAPSGAGKSILVMTVIERMRWYYSLNRVITYTTKSARPSERDGRDYYFISEREFKHKIKHGFFMEWSTAYNYYYGSPCAVIDEVERGYSYILVIDRVGAEKVMHQYKKAVLIWLYTKGIEVLRDRLLRRNTEDKWQIYYRLDRARQEISQEVSFPLYHYHVLNDDFEVAIHRLEKIIRHELRQNLSL
jgi:guanylate kinase